MKKRVLVLGSTGVLGRSLAVKLVESGCDVIGTGTGARFFPEMAERGVMMKQLDAFDGEQLTEVLTNSGDIDVVVNLMSKIPASLTRHATTEFSQNNSLNLFTAKPIMKILNETVRPERYIVSSHLCCTAPFQKSITTEAASPESFNTLEGRGIPEAYNDSRLRHQSNNVLTTNELVHPKEYPHLDSQSPFFAALNQGIYRRENIAMRYLAGHPVVLRMGFLYGPGTQFGENGAVFNQAANEGLRYMGFGSAGWSFVHVDDAARALLHTVMAPQAASGTYNVVNNDRPTTREWMSRVAHKTGGPPPRKLGLFRSYYAFKRASHFFFLSSMMRAGDPELFNTTFVWEPKQPPMWEQ